MTLFSYDSSLETIWSWSILVTFISYIAIVNALRFSRQKRMHLQFNYPDRSSMAAMTVEDAQKIQNYLMQSEFPFTMHKALDFALFRTYAIPSISKLLVQTAQLADQGTAPKRWSG